MCFVNSYESHLSHNQFTVSTWVSKSTRKTLSLLLPLNMCLDPIKVSWKLWHIWENIFSNIQFNHHYHHLLPLNVCFGLISKSLKTFSNTRENVQTHFSHLLPLNMCLASISTSFKTFSNIWESVQTSLFKPHFYLNHIFSPDHKISNLLRFCDLNWFK